MEQDRINKRLREEVRSREFAIRKDLVDQVEAQCEFCLDILTSPVTLPCSHSFCQSCIKSHHSCSSCRADIKDAGLEVNQEMKACLQLIFPGYDN